MSIPLAAASGYFCRALKYRRQGLNTFGCIVVVAKEAVVDFPGVTLFLHW